VQEATVEGARERLQIVRAQMHKALIDHRKANPMCDNSKYTQEMFPVSDSERRIAL
jgi:predicted RNase H-like HicB family nuclease